MNNINVNMSPDKVPKNKLLPQIFSACILYSLLVTAGTHMIWPSPSIPLLLSQNTITNEEVTIVVTIESLGQVIGNIIFAMFIDQIGRKVTLLPGAILYILSSILIYFHTKTVILLYLARIIAGVANGCLVLVSVVYIGEISESRVRGFLSSVIMASWTFGAFFINMVGAYYTIETTSLVMLIPTGIFLSLYFYMPESPYFYLMKRNPEKAGSSLRRLRWNEEIKEELHQMQEDVERQMSERGKFQDIFLNKSNRRATIIVLVIEAFQGFSGISSLSLYGQTFFAEATDLIPEEWAAGLMQLLKFSAMLVSGFLMDKLGRRLILLFSSFISSVLLILISVYFLIKDYSGMAVDKYNGIILILLLLFVMCYMAGMGAGGKCLIVELFSASIKSKAICFSNIFFNLMIFACANFYQILGSLTSTGCPLLVFGVLQMGAFGFVLFYVPETKKQSLEEIQQNLKK